MVQLCRDSLSEPLVVSSCSAAHAFSSSDKLESLSNDSSKLLLVVDSPYLIVKFDVLLPVEVLDCGVCWCNFVVHVVFVWLISGSATPNENPTDQSLGIHHHHYCR